MYSRNEKEEIQRGKEGEMGVRIIVGNVMADPDVRRTTYLAATSGGVCEAVYSIMHTE